MVAEKSITLYTLFISADIVKKLLMYNVRWINLERTPADQ